MFLFCTAPGDQGIASALVVFFQAFNQLPSYLQSWDSTTVDGSLFCKCLFSDGRLKVGNLFLLKRLDRPFKSLLGQSQCPARRTENGGYSQTDLCWGNSVAGHRLTFSCEDCYHVPFLEKKPHTHVVVYIC